MADYRLIPSAVDPQTRLALRMADLDQRLARLEARAYGPPLALTPYFANGWRMYNGSANQWAPPLVNRDGATVVLQGLIDKAGGNFTANETMFNLPISFVPYNNLIFNQPAAGGGAEGGCQVRVYGLQSVSPAPGAVQIGNFGGPANPVSWVSLAGMVYTVPTV